MEGITERVFRDLVVAEGGVGAACTEFLRITQAPVPRKVIRRDWRPAGTAQIGVQFMVADPQHLAASIANAEAEGAAFIDLNFGCPAPVVFNKCAGSALLDHPDRVGDLVGKAVAATTLPVTAKIRAGVANVERLDEVIRAIADAGAAALCIHGRLRVQGYHVPATWSWIARAVTVRDQVRPDLPIIGNGSVDVAADAVRLRQETGCDAIMIGRGALANPWIFREIAGGSPGTISEVAAFARAYGAGLAEACGERRAAARLKQFIKYVHAGGCFANEPSARQQLLRAEGLAPLLAWADGLANT
jgi:tRNA-dihydrouridine synthase